MQQIIIQLISGKQKTKSSEWRILVDYVCFPEFYQISQDATWPSEALISLLESLLSISGVHFYPY